MFISTYFYCSLIIFPSIVSGNIKAGEEKRKIISTTIEFKKEFTSKYELGMSVVYWIKRLTCRNHR